MLDSPSMRADAGVSAARAPRPELEERRRAKERAIRLRRRLIIGGCSATVLVVVLGIGIGFAGATDRIPAGVTIDGVDVGGMTAAEAEQALEARAGELATEPVRFTAAARSSRFGQSASGSKPTGARRSTRRWPRGTDFSSSAASSASRSGSRAESLQPSVDREATADRRGARPLREGDRHAGEGGGDRAARARARSSSRPSRGGRSRGPAPSRCCSPPRSASSAGLRYPLPVNVAEPTVTAPDLAPVVRQVRTALSAPVKLRYRKTTLTVTPLKMSEFLVLPSEGTTELAVGGDAADEVLRQHRQGARSRAAQRRVRARRQRPDPHRPLGERPRAERRDRARIACSRRRSPRLRGPARLAVTTTTPEITTEKAKGMGITGVVSSYTTTYGGDPNRLSNVQLVSELLDDHLIAPGEVFSFNETTGERNAEKGFLEAPVIINGELQTGLGGGVCQVSTTVFNAAFEAGPLDRGAHEPRALHQPLSDRSRRDRQLSRHRPEVHERHGALALAPNVRRLRVADGEPLRDAGRPAGRVRDVAAQDVRGRSPSRRSRTTRCSSARSGSRTGASPRGPSPFGGSSTTRTASSCTTPRGLELRRRAEDRARGDEASAGAGRGGPGGGAGSDHGG